MFIKLNHLYKKNLKNVKIWNGTRQKNSKNKCSIDILFLSINKLLYFKALTLILINKKFDYLHYAIYQLGLLQLVFLMFGEFKQNNQLYKFRRFKEK